MLSGDNGILQKATDAKTQTGIGQEKETIALAYNSALAKKVSNGNSSTITDSELNDELDSSEATATGNPIIVIFTKSGNAYEIDSNGVIKPSTPKDPSQKTVNDLEVGDYVKYGAKLTKKSYSTDTSETGYTNSQTFETDTNMLWRVISKNNGKVELVATKNVLTNNGTGLYFSGKTGFLNAEKVFKNLCETLYNSDYGTSRSINEKDINDLTSYNPESDEYYNRAYTFTEDGPFWKKDENGNETFEYASSSNPITQNRTCYSYTVDEDTPLYDSLIKNSGGYWLGSRCIEPDDGAGMASINLRCIDNESVGYKDLFGLWIGYYTDGSETSQVLGIRPIVTLKTGIQITLGDGTQGSPYELK